MSYRQADKQAIRADNAPPKRATLASVKGYNPGREGVRMGVQLTDGIRLKN